MDTLPNELLLPIHANLPVSDLLNSLSVCRLWNSISGSNDWIWNELLIRDFDVKPVKEGSKERYVMLFQMRNTTLRVHLYPYEHSKDIMDAADEVLEGRRKDQATFVMQWQGTSTVLSFSVFYRAFRTPESITYVICSGRRVGGKFISLVGKHDLFINSMIRYERGCIELKNGSSIIILAGYEWLTDRRILEYVKNPKARVIADGVGAEYLIKNAIKINASSDVTKEIGLTFIRKSFNPIEPFSTFEFSKWVKEIESSLADFR